mmetsp:Transcript_21824/g.55718  ORF Transcript_21824/g.55718 Transcript_21824/m.55718 type:complete len:180 (+) Transcript_21824:262-801(+)
MLPQVMAALQRQPPRTGANARDATLDTLRLLVRTRYLERRRGADASAPKGSLHPTYALHPEKQAELQPQPASQHQSATFHTPSAAGTQAATVRGGPGHLGGAATPSASLSLGTSAQAAVLGHPSPAADAVADAAPATKLAVTSSAAPEEPALKRKPSETPSVGSNGKVKYRISKKPKAT